VEYKPGATNVVADALSRHDTESATTMAISSSSFELFDNLGWEIEEDPDFCSLRAGTHDKDWHVTDGLVLVAGRIYLPGTSSTISLACATTHGARHEGVAKTLHRLRADFHVPGACTLVAEFAYACATCHRNKAEQLQPSSTTGQSIDGVGRHLHGCHILKFLFQNVNHFFKRDSYFFKGFHFFEFKRFILYLLLSSKNQNI
jgi:hypothetical protein